MAQIIRPIIYFKLGFLVLVVFMLAGCKKTDTLVDVPSQAHFTNLSGDTYFITGPNVVKKIPIGLTTVSNSERTITFSVSSPTGAVAGTHYNIIGGNSIKIPAGKVIDSITVAGIYSQYLSGRKDTLVFTITDGTDTKASTYNTTFKLFMRGPCSETEIVFTQMLGSYTKTFENGSYGPYTTTITNFTPTSATSGTASFTNLYDSDITAVATFDWSTPGNFKVTIAAQPTQYGLSIRSAGGVPGTFTYCVNSFRIPLELFSAGGIYDSWIMTMAR